MQDINILADEINRSNSDLGLLKLNYYDEEHDNSNDKFKIDSLDWELIWLRNN